MRMPRRFVLALAVLVAPLAPALAQTCHGMNSFANGKMRIAAGLQSFDGGSSYGVQGAYGKPSSLYASLSVGQTKVDGSSESSTDFGIEAGWQIPFKSNPFEVCPMVGWSRSSNDPVTATSWGFGGGIGYAVPTTGQVQFVPAGGLNWASTTVEVGSVSADDSAMAFWGTAGFIVNKKWTLAPGFFKSTEDGAKMVWTLAVGFNWGN